MELKIMRAALVILTVVLAVMVASPAFASFAHPHMDHHNHHTHRKHHPHMKKGKRIQHGHWEHHSGHPHSRHHKPAPEPEPPEVDREAPSTTIGEGLRASRRVGETARYTFWAVDPDESAQRVSADYFECRSWGFEGSVTWNEAHGVGVPWKPCDYHSSHSYVVSDHYHQTFEVRAVDHAGNVDPTPASHHFTTYDW